MRFFYKHKCALLYTCYFSFGVQQQQKFVFNFIEKRREIYSTRKEVRRRREKGKAYVSCIGAGLLGPD